MDLGRSLVEPASHCPPQVNPDSAPSSALPLRPQTAPYLSHRGRSRLLRGAWGPGMGWRATAPPPRGRGGTPRRAPQLPAPGPCRPRHCFSTADSSRPQPVAARSAWRGPGSPASWPGPAAAAAQPSARPEAAPRRLGRAARRVSLFPAS